MHVVMYSFSMFCQFETYKFFFFFQLIYVVAQLEVEVSSACVSLIYFFVEIVNSTVTYHNSVHGQFLHETRLV